MWEWDEPQPGAVFDGGHWVARETGERVSNDVVHAHLLRMGVTVL
jgi:hypothetical protein